MDHDALPDRLLRRREVERRVGLATSSLYRLLGAGQFPLPVRIGSTVRWSAAEVEAWVASRPRGVGRGK